MRYNGPALTVDGKAGGVTSINLSSALGLWGAIVLFLSIVWPRYGYFALGPLPQVTPFTALAILSWGVVPLFLLADRSIAALFARGVRQHRTIVLLFIGWYLWRLLSDMLGESPEDSLLITLRELVYLGVMLPLVLAVLCMPGGKQRLFRGIVVATTVVVGLALLEAAAQKPIVQVLNLRFAADAQSIQNVVVGEIRGGAFRLKSTFGHPIVFGQYLAWVFPVLFAVFRVDRSFIIRAMTFFCLGVTPMLVWATGSRAALLGLIISTGCYAATAFIRRVGLRSRGGVLAAISLVLAVVLAIGPGQALLGNLVAGRNAVEASSTNYRRAMFEKGFEAIGSSPLFGFGDGRAAYHAGFSGIGGSLTIDSLYLSTLLAAGWVGAAILIWLFFSALIALGRRMVGGGGTDIDVALLASTAALGVTFSILSIGDNLTLLFFALGAAMASAPISIGQRGRV